MSGRAQPGFLRRHPLGCPVPAPGKGSRSPHVLRDRGSEMTPAAGASVPGAATPGPARAHPRRVPPRPGAALRGHGPRAERDRHRVSASGMRHSHSRPHPGLSTPFPCAGSGPGSEPRPPRSRGRSERRRKPRSPPGAGETRDPAPTPGVTSAPSERPQHRPPRWAGATAAPVAPTLGTAPSRPVAPGWDPPAAVPGPARSPWWAPTPQESFTLSAAGGPPRLSPSDPAPPRHLRRLCHRSALPPSPLPFQDGAIGLENNSGAGKQWSCRTSPRRDAGRTRDRNPSPGVAAGPEAPPAAARLLQRRIRGTR